MNKKFIGSIVAALVIGAMIVIMVKSNLDKPQPISDQSAIILDEQLNQTDSNNGLAKGDLPPDFTLTTLDGETVQLSELKGKKVMLNFWASWCPPCIAEMPHMQSYYENYSEEDNAEIVAVNLTKAEKLGIDAVGEFIDAYGLTFPVPLDRDGTLMEAYQAFTIPTTYMIHTDGTIAQKIIGPMDENRIREMFQNLE